jgi:hypothetical protein
MKVFFNQTIIKLVELQLQINDGDNEDIETMVLQKLEDIVEDKRSAQILIFIWNYRKVFS